MEITASLVKELRDKTGAGMMDCKKALSETSGDFEKAVDYLRKKGIASAAKKAGRTTKEGAVTAFTTPDGKTSVILELNCETDFVARTEQFRNFLKDVSEHIATANPADSAALMGQAYVKNAGKTIEALLKEAIANLGENLSIRRFARYSTDVKSAATTYIHGEGKVGVIVEVGMDKDVRNQDAFRTYLKDLSMQIAAASPSFVKSDEIPKELVAKEKEIAIAQMANSGKPANVLEKIAEGKIKKYFEETCLVNQTFVKDPSKTITQLTQEVGKATGATLTIKRFNRFLLGEGIEAATEETH